MSSPTYVSLTNRPEEYFDTVLQRHYTGHWNQPRFLQNLQGNVVWYGGLDLDDPTPLRLPLVEIYPQLTQNIEPTDTENLRFLCHLLVESLPSETLIEIIKIARDHIIHNASPVETHGELSSSTEGSEVESHRQLFELAEQFEQEQYHLSLEEEATFLDEEYLEWLENN